MGKNIKTLTAILSLTVLYGIYYWGIPAIVNIPERVDFIEKNVYEQTGFKIKIENPSLKMGLIPSVWLQADDLSILNDDNTKALEVNSPDINIRLLPLVFKELKIKYFSADSINANFIFDKNSKLKLGQYELKNQELPPVKLKQLTAHIDDYNIKLDDQLQNKKMYLDGKYLDINDFIADKKINLSTIAQLNTGNKTSYIKADLDLNLPANKILNNQCELNGHIVNLDLSDFSIYAKAFSKNKIDKISGLINFTAKTNIQSDNQKQIKTALYLKNFGIYKKDKSKSIYFDDKLTITSSINTIRNGIDINELKVLGKGIDAFVSGKIDKLNDKMPNLDLKIAINKSKTENIIPLLPGEKDLCPEINLQLLKETGFWGDVMGNLTVKGKADMPDVNGDALVSNGYLLKPIPNADKATIKLQFSGKTLNLDVKVPTGNNQEVLVKGPIELYKEKNADLLITSTDKVDLKTAQIVLNPLHDILHFDIGPVPIMDINGKGGINLHVIGTKKNPHAWGKFWFSDADVAFIDIHNMRLKNGSGILTFDNQNSHFKTHSAQLNGRPITVDGTCKLTGDLNFNVNTTNQNLGNLLKIVSSSPMLADIQNLTKNIEKASGLADFSLNLTGQVKDVKDVVFNKNIFAKGKITLHSDNIKLKGAPLAISKTSGNINFDNLNADFNLQSNLNNSQIHINGKIKDMICGAEVFSHRFNIGDAIKVLPNNIQLPYSNSLATINTSFIAQYKGAVDNIDFNKIFVKGKIYSNRGAKSAIIVNNSSFELKNSRFKLPNLNGSIKNSGYDISLLITNMFNKNRVVNGHCNFKSLDLNLINDKALQYILPPQLSQQLKDIDFLNGKINLSSRIRNNNLNAYTTLDDVSILYKPKKMKLTVNSGNLLLRNNILNINKLTAQIGTMPIFIDGKLTNIDKNPKANLYINTKPNQEFFDQLINYNALYPIKIKGDAILSTRATGPFNNLNTKSTLNIQENSSLYYMGASIGDVQNPVRITVDSNYSPNKLRIHNLQYDKIITSQNNKPFVNTQLNAYGTLNLLGSNNIGFNNFRIKTAMPTDAKIFNIIFRKPLMKQGVFTSDLTLNGTALNPKINGILDVTSIDIPFVDSTIRDINLNFKNDKIHISSKGTVLTNDIHLNAVMKNKLTPPYIVENMKVNLADLNINKITDSLRDYEAESSRNPTVAGANTIQPFDISQLVIKKAEIEADKINVRNINADNLTATLNLNEKQILNIDKFKFDIAQGNVTGSLKHNLKNHDAILDVHLNNANALITSEALFDLKGQVYGSIDGDFNLKCNGYSTDTCFKTLTGNGTFKISDGRMPKLGSLEYLLKAGNLITSGFTTLSINSLIDLITPLKTGNFESISGDMNIQNGIANKINIYSNGHDLNMYMTGSYNLVTSIADMKIYGSLSKNITSAFGKIKSVSLNTLFNTIPGVNNTTETIILQNEISKIPNINNATDIYRIFMVDINGDINGDKYVKSFKWVK